MRRTGVQKVRRVLGEYIHQLKSGLLPTVQNLVSNRTRLKVALNQHRLGLKAAYIRIKIWRDQAKVIQEKHLDRESKVRMKTPVITWVTSDPTEFSQGMILPTANEPKPPQPALNKANQNKANKIQVWVNYTGTNHTSMPQSGLRCL